MNPPAKPQPENGPPVALGECSRRHKVLQWVIGGLVILALAYATTASGIMWATHDKADSVENDFRAQQQAQVEIIRRIDGTLGRIETEQMHQRGMLEAIRKNGGE